MILNLLITMHIAAKFSLSLSLTPLLSGSFMIPGTSQELDSHSSVSDPKNCKKFRMNLIKFDLSLYLNHIMFLILLNEALNC
jgi:hypothetical protein